MNQKIVYIKDEGAVEKIKELIEDSQNQIIVINDKEENKDLYVIGYGGDIGINTRGLLQALEKQMYHGAYMDENATKKKMNGGRFYPDGAYYHKFNKFKKR